MTRCLALFAITALALAACQPDSPAVPETGTLAIPKLEPAMRTLANGLRVYALPDAGTASVSVAVWYGVGSKHDPAGRSGFAHLFEHLMFKSTANMPAETFNRLTEDVGGFFNAATVPDFTYYFETVPANHLEPLLWAEAERMGSLVVDGATFKSERAVVQEEFRQRVLAQPYGRLFSLHLPQANFAVHPYGRPGIGSIADLDAATLDDVRAFHAAYYRPDNAVLVVAGNFEQRQLDAWVDRYFAPLASPERAIPRVDAVEPQRTSPRSLTIHAPNVPLPAVAISWPAPAADSPDIAAWMALDAILHRGISSRLNQALINGKRQAKQIGSVFELRQQPGTYTSFAILSTGTPVDDGLETLQAGIARIKRAPVSAAELDQARNELITDALRWRETSAGRAEEVARAVVLFGDPAAFATILAQLQQLTPADVQRVARSIMDDVRAVTIRYLPESPGSSGDTSADSSTIRTATIDIPAADIPVHVLAPVRQRRQPPAAAPPVAVRMPVVAESVLPNGLRVIVANRPGQPLVAADLRIAAGGTLDPVDRAGLAAMTANFATRGTTRRSGVWQQFEGLGASLGVAADADAASVSLVARADRMRAAFSILADVVQEPAFKARELENLRQRTLDGLSMAAQQPGSVGQLAMARRLYGADPYGSNPTPRSLKAVTRAETRDFHGKWWRPDNAILVITGDITPEAGFALAEDLLGAWKKPAQALPAPQAGAAIAAANPPLLIDMPNAGQAAVLLGFRGPARASPEYFATLVANSVVGGGYSARLSQEVRIRRGLSYDASSRMVARRRGASIIAAAQTRNDAVPQVVELMAIELGKLGTAAIPATELATRKALLIGSFGREVETTGGLARQLSMLAQAGLPLSQLQTHVADIEAVTSQQVNAAASAHFDPATMSLIVVGDTKVFGAALRARFPQLQRVAVGELNLDSVTLK